LPPRKIILNLAPSDIKKIGTSFDVPMAVAILLMTADITKKAEEGLEKVLFFGEL
jgi:magnesium chelatase family protein